MKQLRIQVQEKHYPGCDASVLQDVSFEIRDGEFLAVVGPSGAGKTTLMNIIAGLDRSADAQVVMQRDGHIIKPKIGYVFQSPRMMPWMTIADNLRLVMEGEADCESRIHTMLDAVGLAGSENLFPGELSGGMLRRAGIARAFVVQPDILLLDEPFVSVDAPTAKRLRELLVKLWQEQRPMVLLISHVLKEAIALSDRILFMTSNPGRLVYELEIPNSKHLNTPEDPAVVQLHDQLLQEHPEILSGMIRKEVASSMDCAS